MTHLEVKVTTIQLECLSEGRLQHWMGPALRGMVLEPLRKRLCLLPAEHLESTSRDQSSIDLAKYCRGCTEMPRCNYGRAFEPDLETLGLPTHRGIQQGLRTVTIGITHRDKNKLSSITENSPEASSSQKGQLSDAPLATTHNRLEIRILQIGSDSFALSKPIIDLVDTLGRKRGFGPDRVQCKVLPNTVSEYKLRLTADQHLPTKQASGPASLTIPRMKIVLQSPLLLKQEKREQNGPQVRKRHYQSGFSDKPDFSQLVRVALRTVRRAINEVANPAWGRTLDMRDILEQCSNVQMSSHELEAFRQNRTSKRQKSTWQLMGWTGSMSFENVPAQVLPVLQWAGILGIGDSRNCGAGLWEIHLT